MIGNFKSKFITLYRGQSWMALIASVYDLYKSKDWLLSEKAKISCRRLREFHNKYSGKRCFILGNGPSLNNTDLSLLTKEYTFGLNKVYLLEQSKGFKPSFLVSTNELVIEQSAEEFNGMKIPKFISWKGSKYINFDENTILLRTLARQGFSKEPDKGLWEGATVTYVAMQLAFYLGFSEVYLIGVDHNFVTKGTPNTVSVAGVSDPNHFAPNYFSGVKWHLPDLETSEYAYRMAKKTFEDSGRCIYDATLNGKLRIFTKVDYRSLFTSS